MTNPVEPRAPKRLRRPRWLDPRVIGGIVLIVAAVVLGSRIIASSSSTVPIWAATRTLAAGTVLADGDLQPVDVNLGGAGQLYLGAHTGPYGRRLTATIHGGELLPAAAVTDPAAGRVVVIPVPPEKFPPGIAHGSVIDLYLTTDAGAAAGNSLPETELLEPGLTVQSVAEPATGGLSGATANHYQVAVLLDAEAADRLVRTLPHGEAVVVLVTGG